MGHSPGSWIPALTFSPSLAPSGTCSCFGPCFLLMSPNFEGRACLSNRRCTLNTFRYIILSILPAQSLREKESMLLHWHVLQALFTLLSKAITDWPQTLIFSVVLGATRGLAHCLTNRWHLSVSNCALHPSCTRWSYVRIKLFSFQLKHYLSWNYHQVKWKSFSDS